MSSIRINFFLILIFIVLTLIGQNQTTNSEFTSFYRFIPEKMTWNEHKKLAVIMGGDLACITNAFENEQVRRIAGGEGVWSCLLYTSPWPRDQRGSRRRGWS